MGLSPYKVVESEIPRSSRGPFLQRFIKTGHSVHRVESVIKQKDLTFYDLVESELYTSRNRVGPTTKGSLLQDTYETKFLKFHLCS